MSINQTGEDEKVALLSPTDSVHHHHHDESLNNLLIKDDRSYLQRTWDDTRKRFTPEHEFAWYIKYYSNPKHSFVLILTLALILVGTANRVFFKKMLIPMVNYPYFISQLSTTVYIPIFWPVVWALMLFTSRVTPEMRKFPLWKFLVMGALDATAGVLMIFGGNQTSGAMQQLLIQGAIPFTMFFSWLVSNPLVARILREKLNVRYRWGHYLGALVIISGIVVALLHAFLSSNGASDNTVFGIIVFFLSATPTAFSGVYKEIAFKGADLDIYYVNAWVCVFQFLVGLLFLPITAIPGFGGLTFPEIPDNLENGALCLFTGHNSITTGKNVDDCEWAWVMTLGYIIANIGYNIVILLMLKYGSAALLYVASAVILPLANIAFTLHFIMGDRATTLSPYDIAGLVVILIGLLIYRSTSEQAPPATEGTVSSDEKREVTHVPVGGFMSGQPEAFPTAVVVKAEHTPRSVTQIRGTYMSRLGMAEGGPRRAHTLYVNRSTNRLLSVNEDEDVARP
jgi:hypothetical protein